MPRRVGAKPRYTFWSVALTGWLSMACRLAAPPGWLAVSGIRGLLSRPGAAGLVDGAHQSDVIAVGIGHDRPPGTPRRRRTAAAAPHSRPRSARRNARRRP